MAFASIGVLGLSACLLTTPVEPEGRELVVASEEASEQAAKNISDTIIARLDISSFNNSTGPRREVGRSTFSDYGFSEVREVAEGVKIYARDGSWMMGFDVLVVSANSVQICFVDQAVPGPKDFVGPSYRTQTALLVARDDSPYWSAQKVDEGFLGCSNKPES